MKVKPTRKEYPGNEVTIVWEPHKCIHSEKCWRNLPEVFRYGQKPWVDPNGASAEAIRERIEGCPSGALSYLGQELASAESEGDLKAKLMPDGPIVVQGSVKFMHADGTESIENNPVLCRCGGSKNKPFCDGSHKAINFKS